MKNYPHLLIFLLASQLLLLSFVKFTAWPEMTLWPYLLLKGWLPYQNIAIAHTPLLLANLAIWYKIAGVGLLQLKMYTWAVVLATSLLVYKASGGDKVQQKATIGFLAFATLHIIYEGNGLWFDLLLAPIAFGAFLSIRSKRYFMTGILFAIMLLTKQTAFWFLPAIMLTLLSQKKRNLAIKKFLLGFVVIFILFILLLSLFGIVEAFWKWAIEFGIFTLPRAQGQISIPGLKQIIFALLPFSILAFTKRKPLVLWAALGALGAIPRFELFHFQPALPFLALAASEVFSDKKYKIIVVYLVILFSMLAFSLNSNLTKETRFYDEDTVNIARYIDQKTIDGTNIYILNDWDHIYTLSNTVPATDPWVPHLSWYMQGNIQNEIVKDLATNKPDYIILRPFEETGLGSFRPQVVLNYIYAHYKQTGKINGRVVMTQK